MRRSALLGLMALALTACGTTVPVGPAVGLSDALGPTPAPPGGPVPAAAAGVAAQGDPGGAPGSAGRVAGGTSVPESGHRDPVALLGADGPGVTDKVMYVGFRVKVNGEQANAAVGAAGISTGDEEQGFRILIDEVNAHGGVAGRKVVPVFHHVDANSTQTNDQLVRAMCADWTEDHHVFAAAFGGDRSLLACLDKARSVSVYDNLATSDEQTLRTYRYYAEISMLNLNRMARAQVVGLAAQGWLSPWNPATGAPGGAGTKVGVVTYDDRSFVSAVKQDLLPALARVGQRSVATAFVRTPQSTAELSTVATDIANAILRFRQEGVEHVVVLDSSGTLTLLFLTAAQNQRYFPRYGFNTQNAVQALLTGGNISSQQLVGSLGIGWLPTLDLRVEDNPDEGPDSNPARRRCLQLYRRHSVTFKDANSKAVALLTCNTLFFLKAAVERGASSTPGVVNRETFLAGVEALGRGFESTATFATRFGPGRHDGADAYRPFAFQQGCGCIRYTGARRVMA